MVASFDSTFCHLNRRHQQNFPSAFFSVFLLLYVLVHSVIKCSAKYGSSIQSKYNRHCQHPHNRASISIQLGTKLTELLSGVRVWVYGRRRRRRHSCHFTYMPILLFNLFLVVLFVGFALRHPKHTTHTTLHLFQLSIMLKTKLSSRSICNTLFAYRHMLHVPHITQWM